MIRVGRAVAKPAQIFLLMERGDKIDFLTSWRQQLGWPSGKNVRIGSCRRGFDSESGNTIDFKIGF